MPKFLFLTTISRHDARLSSTTHCALRASRINYNLTNLSRCNSFLQYFSSMDLCTASCHPAHFLSNSFQCFLVILQALSLSLCQNHQAFHKNKSHMQRNCNTTSHAAQSLILISLTLTTTVRNSIAYIYHISHTTMGHRYFNLAVSCGICLRYAHASHKSASAFRFPTL